MPRPEDIERFAQVLNSLGDEPAIRAARSESIENVPAPEEGGMGAGEPGDGLDMLAAEDEEPGAPAAGSEQENLQDLFAGLSALSDQGTDAESPEIAPAAEADAAEAEGLDFSSLLGEESEAPAIEELDRSARATAARHEAESEPGPEAAPDSAGIEQSFEFPGDEPSATQGDLAQMEVLPEQDFSLPNLDDLAFEEPTAAPSAPADESEQAFDEPEPVAAEPSVEETPLAGFDLDAMSGFEAPPSAPVGGLAEPPGEAAESELAPPMESLGEESLGDLNLEEFSLPESAGQFGVSEPTPAAPPPKKPSRQAQPAAKPASPRAPARAAEPSEPVPELDAAEEAIALTPEQFARIRKTLESLPRNLKIATQDVIADGRAEGRAAGENLAKLVSLLVQGAAAQEIAALVGRITGKTIRIPAGYEKKTGEAFEAEQRSFAYAFRENILPIVRVVVLTVLAGAIVAFLGYRYVYRPLYAIANYRAGYAQFGSDRFTLANERFARAAAVWPMKQWYYRYAEGFAAKRQWVLAEEKYEALLALPPGYDRKGLLDYARMESILLSDYKKAEQLLQRILDRDLYDYDALLASGDNYIEWAQKQREKYESARLAYATLIEKNGLKDEILFRMLRYFIRMDNGEEVERLRAYFAARKDTKIDPAVYAELGGYFVDHRRLDYVQDVLFAAEKAAPNLAEVHYNLARYYRIVRSDSDEIKALDATLERLRPTDALTRKRLAIEIDTHTRLGEYYYRTKTYLKSEQELQAAISLVEQYQRSRIIEADPLFGRPYVVRGDLAYYLQGELTTAREMFRKAIANNYADPGLTFKIGYIQYSDRDYRAALATFAAAEDELIHPSTNEPLASSFVAAAAVTETAAPEGAALSGEAAPAAEPPLTAGQVPVNLLYALGATFFERADYFAAQGYFLRMLDRLETKRAALGMLRPQERGDHRALLENLAKVNNNLGVTMIELAARTGDRTKRSRGLVYLATAQQLADSIANAPGASQRSGTKNLPFLNMQGALYPVRGFVLQIYETIPRDFQALAW